MICDDIMKHIKKVHGFSESNIKDTLKTKPSYYENCFEKIKQVRIMNDKEKVRIKHIKSNF